MSITYRNKLTGRKYERPVEDKWLEASAGWERVEDEPAPEPAKDEHEGSKD